MTWLNLHHLKYFLIIAEEGSMTAASKILLVGQPALSAQLKSFEDYLGVQLFKRAGKKLILSQEGEYVLKYAKAIKQLEDELVSNIAHFSLNNTKEFILGAQESVPKSMIATCVKAISHCGDFKIKVIEGTADDLFRLLMDGKVDFFLGNCRPLEDAKEMIYTSLAKDKICVWGSKKFSRLSKNFPASLEDQNFILPGFQNPLRHDFERFMLEHGLRFSLKIEAQDTALMKELAASGEGLILAGQESVNHWLKNGDLFKIGTINTIHDEFWLGMVKKKIDNDLIKKILKTLSL